MAYTAGGYNSTVLAAADGVVHYWPFNETSGTSIADTVGTATFTVSNESVADNTIVSGKFGNGRNIGITSNKYSPYTYKAKADIAAYYTDPVLTTFTVSLWFVAEDLYSYSTFTPNIFYWNGLYVRLTATGGMTVGAFKISLPSSTISTYTPYHLVLVQDSTSARLYLNNVLVSTRTAHDYSFNIYTPSYMGCMNNYGSGFNVGYMDDFAVWNRALTAEEIGLLYDSGTGSPVVNPSPAPTLETLYIKDLLGSHLLRTDSLAKITQLHVGLLESVDPITEITAAGYTRILRAPSDANWASGGGGWRNQKAIQFPVMAEDAHILGYGLFNAATNGGIIAARELIAPVDYTAGSTGVVFPANSLLVTID